MSGLDRFVARDALTGDRLAIEVADGTIASVLPAPSGDDIAGPAPWVAPAFWDLQTNGRWGVSYSDPTITADQVAAIVRANAAQGVARLCPTLITASHESMRLGAAAIAEACDRSPDVERMVLGLHLEGPSISEVDGYRGAHPGDHVRGPDWDEFSRLQEASGDRVILVTLAPERPGAIAFIGRARAAGVAVAIGHTAADPVTIDLAVSAGATLSTHLGNGIASPLPRHPNPIWAQAADDRLWASIIADGHHLDRATLRVLLRAKRGRVLLVSDASPLAGLPPGRYGDWAVEATGRVVVAGTPYLAGANRSLEDAVNEVLAAEPGPLAPALAMANAHPADFLGCRAPRIAEGHPANLIRFNWDGTTFRLIDTCVDGRWTPRGEAGPPPGWS